MNDEHGRDADDAVAGFGGGDGGRDNGNDGRYWSTFTSVTGAAVGAQRWAKAALRETSSPTHYSRTSSPRQSVVDDVDDNLVEDKGGLLVPGPDDS